VSVLAATRVPVSHHPLAGRHGSLSSGSSYTVRCLGGPLLRSHSRSLLTRATPGVGCSGRVVGVRPLVRTVSSSLRWFEPSRGPFTRAGAGLLLGSHTPVTGVIAGSGNKVTVWDQRESRAICYPSLAHRVHTHKGGNAHITVVCTLGELRAPPCDGVERVRWWRAPPHTRRASLCCVHLAHHYGC
jgi:hypothetical protein